MLFKQNDLSRLLHICSDWLSTDSFGYVLWSKPLSKSLYCVQKLDYRNSDLCRTSAGNLRKLQCAHNSLMYIVLPRCHNLSSCVRFPSFTLATSPPV